MFYFFTLICAQIILESFPVSSSGHIILLERFFTTFLHKDLFFISSDKIFSHFLHGPTVCIIPFFFLHRWIFLLKNIKRCWRIIGKLIFFVLVADSITFLYFVLFNTFFYRSFFSVGVGFVISAIALFSLRYKKRKNIEKLDLKKVIILGNIQGLSLLPGLSRFGLTFVSACWLGIDPKKAFEFSFAIQWPLIAAGFLKSIVLLSDGQRYSHVPWQNFNFVLIIVSASLVAFFALYFVERLIKAEKVWLFSVFLLFSFVIWLIV